MEKDNKVFDWDDVIEDDGGEMTSVVLKPGVYDFEVWSVEKTYFTAKEGSKIPDCPEADVMLKITAPEGTAYVKDRFYLVKTTEWRISSFYRSIGLKKHGEKFRMQWNDLEGRKGKVKIGNRSYQDEMRNEVKSYIDPPVLEDEDEGIKWN